MLVKLAEHGTDVQMSICLYFWSLETRFNGQSLLKIVKGGSHLADPAVIASHVVEGHRLAQLVVFA